VPFRGFFSFSVEAEEDEDSPASEPDVAGVSSEPSEARGGETTRRRDPTRVATRAFAPRAIDVTEWARDA
jgi:hypothetical protein